MWGEVYHLTSATKEANDRDNRRPQRRRLQQPRWEITRAWTRNYHRGNREERSCLSDGVKQEATELGKECEESRNEARQSQLDRFQKTIYWTIHCVRILLSLWLPRTLPWKVLQAGYLSAPTKMLSTFLKPWEKRGRSFITYFCTSTVNCLTEGLMPHN